MIKQREQHGADWVKVEERNSYSLVYSKERNLYAEEYQLTIPSTTIMEKWNARLKLKGSEIIQILDHTFADCYKSPTLRPGGCKVYVQVVAFRLSQTFNSEFDYQEQWLIQCLKGFQKLYNRYGCFRIKSSMVAITPNFKAKVWLNPNFLCNSKMEAGQSESSMVTATINLFKRVNIVIPEQNISFAKIIDFLENKELTKVRSRSDIIYIDKLEFKDKESLNSSCSETKSSFSDLHKGMKSPSKMEMNQRLTFNHIQIPPFSKYITSQSEVVAKILNPSLNFQRKIGIMDEILSQNSQSSLRKFCEVYKHGLIYNDQELLKELQDVQGRLSSIKNIVVLEKISFIVNKKQNSRQIVPLERVSEILNKERAKRSRHASNDVKDDHSIGELKNEAQRLLFD